MKYISVADAQLPTHNEDWELTYNRFLPILSELPQKKSGLLDNKLANQWLEQASKNYNQRDLGYQISTKLGFRAQEVRALWAEDNNEYYPKLGGIEVYASKSFRTIDLIGEEDKKRKIDKRQAT